MNYLYETSAWEYDKDALSIDYSLIEVFQYTFSLREKLLKFTRQLQWKNNILTIIFTVVVLGFV